MFEVNPEFLAMPLIRDCVFPSIGSCVMDCQSENKSASMLYLLSCPKVCMVFQKSKVRALRWKGEENKGHECKLDSRAPSLGSLLLMLLAWVSNADKLGLQHTTGSIKVRTFRLYLIKILFKIYRLMTWYVTDFFKQEYRNISPVCGVF